MTMTRDDIIAELIAITGAKYTIADRQEMTPYLTDWRGHYHGAALAVTHPGSTDEVARIIQLADRHAIPVVPQGGNTSLCGGATPDDNGTAIVLSMTRMDRIRHLDLSSQSIVVEAGCILEHIQIAAEAEGLVFPLNFGARGTCRIGGNLSTNAGGLNVVRYGNARQLCLGLEVVTPKGEVMDLLSPLKKDNTGYDLKNLFIGAEGTLGVITAATLQLFPEPKARATAWAGVRDINAAITMLQRAQSDSGGNVIAFELMPRSIVENVREHFPDTIAPLDDMPEFSCLIELASTAAADARPRADGTLALQVMMENLLAEGFEDGLVLHATIAQNENQRQAIWAIRDLTPEIEIKAGPAYKSDISIPHEHMAEFYDRAATAIRAIVPDVRLFGFGHMGDGNLHYNLA
ncbi:MAG: FAD-binding oxidoreductase, partial [Alphaproteobacteria bacterium]|nr:FAD-binding oxidoreductase [Alphaproteobacteria bacterium]